MGGATTLGNPFTWTLHVANVGTAVASFASTQTIVLDNLPNANITYGTVSISNITNVTGNLSSGITANDLTVSANGAVSIGVNGSFDITFTATPTAAGTFANPRAGGTAMVDPNNNVVEGNETNNTANDTVVVTAPDLTLTKTDNVGGATTLGTPFTWTLHVANTGTAAASFANAQTVVLDNLPNANINYGTVNFANFTNVTGAGNLSGGITTSNLTVSATGAFTIGVGGSFDITFTATPTATGTFVNPLAGGTAKVDPNNNVVESNENNNTGTDTVVVTAPDLTLTKTDNVGGATTLGTPFTWTLHVANTGNAAAAFANAQTIVLDNLPNPNITYGTVSISNVTNVTGTLNGSITANDLTVSANGAVSIGAGGSFDITFTATPTAVGTFANPRTGGTAKVDPNGNVTESNENNNTANDTVVVTAPDLTLTKTDNVGGVTALGFPWTWTLHVANSGNASATFTAAQTVVLDNLPNTNINYSTVSFGNFTSVTGSNNLTGTITANDLTVAATGAFTIGVGGSFDITFTATATANGTYANPRTGGTAKVDPNNNVTESNENNNTGSDTVVVAATLKLSGEVYVDTNKNAALDATESGLAGVIVTLRDNTGALVASTTTAADGTYQFTNLSPGTYSVVEIQPNGYGSSTPNTIPVTLTNVNLTNVNFGETLGTISGFVYVDVNNNGVMDPGEPPIDGVPLTLTGTTVNGTPVTKTTITQPGGGYSFTGLLAGTYTVSEPLPTGYSDGLDAVGTINSIVVGTQTAAGNPDVFSTIVLPAGQDGINYDFGERSPTNTVLSGVVWYDKNSNGVIDPGEPGIGGVIIELRNPINNQFLASTTTAPDGSYVFLNVVPGNYRLIEITPTGYGNSTVRSLLPTVPPTGLTNQNFGNNLGTLSGFVYVDPTDPGVKDPGEPGIPGVIVTLTGTDANLQSVTKTTTTGPDGSYSFTELLSTTGAGYTITETQPTGFNQGTNTPGTINGVTDGALGTVDVIQNITMTPAQNGINYNFGEVNPAGKTFLSGTVYVDANANTTFDPGETTVPGVAVTLKDSTGVTTIATTTTDANGGYIFTGIAPGSYTVVETPPAGYAIDTPATLNPTVPANGLPNQNFGLIVSSLGGNVYVDANNDGIFQPGEAGIAMFCSPSPALMRKANRSTEPPRPMPTATITSPVCSPARTRSLKASRPISWMARIRSAVPRAATIWSTIPSAASIWRVARRQSITTSAN